MDDREYFCCEICNEDKSNLPSSSSTCCFASSLYCNSCVTIYIRNALRTGNPWIRCPNPACTSKIDVDDFREVLPKEDLQKWELLLVKSIIPDKNKLYCPFPDCNVLLWKDSPSCILGFLSKKRNCPLCLRDFCINCDAPWHKGMNCSRFKKTQFKKNEKSLFKIAHEKQWKRCPACKAMIEKSSGCRNITCRCGHQFCYKCRAPWQNCNAICRLKRLIEIY